ncbi:MAG: transcription termination/antitermination protein NusA, partial [Patescibacteria group bacterium]
EVISLKIDETEKKAVVEVTESEQSLAIGKGGQNVRLAAKLTGWKIYIRSAKGEEIATAEAEPRKEPTINDLQPTTTEKTEAPKTEERPEEKKE